MPTPSLVATPASQAQGPSPPPSPSGLLYVHVAGKVRHPGVFRLPPGSRVADAIDAAGGPRHGARTDTLNLARRVVDGEQLLVGVPARAAPSPPGQPGLGSPSGPLSPAAPGEPLDLNTATVEQFDALPGVGPVLARRIVDYRTQHGGFRTVDQLQDVSGIGPSRFADLKPLVRV